MGISRDTPYMGIISRDTPYMGIPRDTHNTIYGQHVLLNIYLSSPTYLSPQANIYVIYLSSFQVGKIALEATVWDYDRFSVNEFIGEVLIDLCDADLSGKAYWYPLYVQNPVGCSTEFLNYLQPVKYLSMNHD
eukprot:sb/3474888/